MSQRSAAERREPLRGRQQPWCVADGGFGGGDSTTCIRPGPDGARSGPSQASPVVTKTFDAAYDEAVYALLNQADGYRTATSAGENMPFVSHFRRWVDLCQINWSSVVVGDYLLQITSTADRTRRRASSTST